MSLNHYETIFILNPVLTDVQVKEKADGFKKLLKDNKAELVHEESWGMKKMAYPIQNKKSAFYELIEFKAPADVVAKLETEFKREESILRFMTVSLDKYAIEFNEKRRKNNKNKKKATAEKQEEAV